MGLRKARPFTFKPRGLSDALDATNVFQGAMSSLQNLIPAPHTANAFVPRPASNQLTTFGGFNTPAGVTALFVVGTRAYGMISSADFAGKDTPFCYDLVNNAFIAISGRLSANLPTTQSTAGDWQPPKMAMISNTRIIVTHPGFAGGGGGFFFGWIDISGFTSNTLTGTSANGSNVITAVSADPRNSGFQPGMTIQNANNDFPAGTTIVSMTINTITVSNNATAGHAGAVLTVTGGTFAAPQWGAGNTNTNPLVAVPNSVEQFNGRAYYAVNNSLVFSDALNPTQVTNATQVLVAGDSVAITALSPLGLVSSVVGGVIQALIVFKGESSLWQVTGDQATGNLALNANPAQVGTLAPNTICQTPKGCIFMAADGVRIMDEVGRVGDPIGLFGSGVCVPFQNAVNPSRAAAAYNQNVFRLSIKNGTTAGQPMEEYWLDMTLGIWTGPHTFPAGMIDAYQGLTSGGITHGFVLAASGVNAKLFSSNASISNADTYVENGAALSWSWQTTLLPDNEQTSMNALGETNIAMSLPRNAIISVWAFDETGQQLDTVQFQGSVAGAIWNAFTWGAAVWGQLSGFFKQYLIPWSQPIVFKQMKIRIVGASAMGTVISNLYFKYQPLGYNLP